MKRFALHGVNTPALIVYVYSNYAIIYLGNIRLVGRLSPLRLYALVTADLPEAVNGGWQRAPSFPLAHDATSGASPTPHEPDAPALAKDTGTGYPSSSPSYQSLYVSPQPLPLLSHQPTFVSPFHPFHPFPITLFVLQSTSDALSSI